MILKRSEPPEREYFEHEIEPLLASDIELHENVSHEKKVDMLGRACAMIFPIRWPEPFGLVMVEAMACGTPVVTTNWGAAPELVDDGVTGFRRDGDDDLVEAIGAARDALARRRAGPGSRSCSRPRPWSGATRRSTSRPSSTPKSGGIPALEDFHYGRSVITMTGVAPPRPDARPDVPALEIDDLHVSVDDREILRGVSLAVEPGSLHALMGPNGSGKSTLANTLLANPAYVVTAGRILLAGEDITALPTDERARRGLFLGFQHPEEIPGVSVLNFLRQAIARRKGIDDFSVLEVRLTLIEWTKRLGMDSRFQERYLNEGFSGGEKKRNEVLQMAMMEPDVAVLDETDSGLDIDALRQVAAGIAEVRNARPQLGILAITHYQRLLEHLVPDVVHVLVDGRIVATGGPEISLEVEARGFDAFRARTRRRTA